MERNKNRNIIYERPTQGYLYDKQKELLDFYLQEQELMYPSNTNEMVKLQQMKEGSYPAAAEDDGSLFYIKRIECNGLLESKVIYDFSKRSQGVLTVTDAFGKEYDCVRIVMGQPSGVPLFVIFTLISIMGNKFKDFAEFDESLENVDICFKVDFVYDFREFQYFVRVKDMLIIEESVYEVLPHNGQPCPDLIYDLTSDKGLEYRWIVDELMTGIEYVDLFDEATVEFDYSKGPARLLDDKLKQACARIRKFKDGELLVFQHLLVKFGFVVHHIDTDTRTDFINLSVGSESEEGLTVLELSKDFTDKPICDFSLFEINTFLLAEGLVNIVGSIENNDMVAACQKTYFVEVDLFPNDDKGKALRRTLMELFEDENTNPYRSQLLMSTINHFYP